MAGTLGSVKKSHRETRGERNDKLHGRIGREETKLGETKLICRNFY